MYGARVSLLLAPAAAILCVAVSALLGVTAGFFGGLWQQSATILMDLFLCLPWIFVLLAVRAVLPLNVQSSVSIAITFLLLGLLAWAPGARMLRSGTQALINDDFALQARASGLQTSRLIGVHLLPQLRPLLVSQFWMLLPAFLLTEANLGMLGLGVTEPMPSLGNLLGELSNVHRVTAAPWILAPAVFLVLVLICLNLMLPAVASHVSSRVGTHL